jgi:pilus assembly protein Flp/PilA
MSPLARLTAAFLADRKGVTAMEYGVIAGVLALTIASTFSTLTGKLVNAFNALNF